MYFFYILESEKTGNYYYGFTNDLTRRLFEHNRGNQGYDRGRIPWKLIYKESYRTETEARNREKHFKQLKNKRYIKEIIRGASSIGRATPS